MMAWLMGAEAFANWVVLAILSGMNDTLRRRWYRLTPDRFVIGLLIVECLLWVPEKFQWFPFNEKKGWTMLFAAWKRKGWNASLGITSIT